MSRKKKTEAQPEAPMAIDKSETLAHEDSPIALSGRRMTIEQDGPVSFQFQTCPVCGTRRASVTTPNNEIRWLDVCPIDGHRFEEN